MYRYIYPLKRPIRRTLIILVIVAAGIKIFSLDSAAVERYYSNGLYPYIGIVQRFLFGWVPFSVGDILYAAAGIWLIRQVAKWVRAVRAGNVNRTYVFRSLQITACVALGVYCAFNLLWGLNYNRYGIDYQLKLESSKYEREDLVEVAEQLVLRMNELQEASVEPRKRLYKKRNLFLGAQEAYEQLREKQSIFRYPNPSIKPSIYSYLGNYLGFTGYYNPFTGEAQVNTAVPIFLRPFTSCHEIGHQLGYAKESEANFAAYLSGTSSRDPAFLYSVYFEMYAYAAGYLYYSDSASLKRIKAQLSSGVKSDLRELHQFLKKYNTPIETAIDKLYSQFLRANEQPSGKMSYSEVVGMLIAYYKREGHL